jgi:hypothetical protein
MMDFSLSNMVVPSLSAIFHDTTTFSPPAPASSGEAVQ